MSVHLGQVNPGSHDNQVYMCLHGDQGSSGRRLLKHSLSNPDRFQERQVDVFSLEAVNLGDLIKLTIGHYIMEKGDLKPLSYSMELRSYWEQTFVFFTSCFSSITIIFIK